jgi:hypothetical protein
MALSTIYLRRRTRSNSRSPRLLQQVVRECSEPSGLDTSVPSGWDTTLYRWADLYLHALGFQPESFRKQLREPFTMSSGCSCTGAPSECMDLIFGESNFREVYASEIHTATRQFFLKNRVVGHCFCDITHTLHRTAKCAVHDGTIWGQWENIIGPELYTTCLHGMQRRSTS